MVSRREGGVAISPDDGGRAVEKRITVVAIDHFRYGLWRQNGQLTDRYPATFTEQYPLSATCTCGLEIKSVVFRIDPRTFGTSGHRIAYAATQGITSALSKVFDSLVSVCLDDLWNTVV